MAVPQISDTIVPIDDHYNDLVIVPSKTSIAVNDKSDEVVSHDGKKNNIWNVLLFKVGVGKKDAVASELSGPNCSLASPVNGIALGQSDAHGIAWGTKGAWLMKLECWLEYIRTREFWIVLILGQCLALCITGTNTFSSLLAEHGTSIPAFQTFFNYVLLNLVYTTYTLYRYGFRKWCSLMWNRGWKYFILSFLDVEGNYFVVLAYRYTNILSAQLINFWAILVVVFLSLVFLRVHYHTTQYVGIILCCGGMGILLGSDHIRGINGGAARNAVKGDLLALAGATFYGLANVFEEVLVSRAPLFEVVGQLGFWGMLINGAQAGIFDRGSFRNAVWDAKTGGWLAGYTIVLSIFYSIAPLVFRLSSAAFFNISLLTANFWGVVIGVGLFNLIIHWMYPIAFVLIVSGLFVYFLAGGVWVKQSSLGLARIRSRVLTELEPRREKLKEA